MTNVTEDFIIVLKAIYSDSFSSKSLKVKMFIIQINNKIADTVRAIKDHKIKYVMLLL